MPIPKPASLNKFIERHHQALLTTGTADNDEDGPASSQISVEVTAVEGPRGVLKDEIMIVLPLWEEEEKELDEDPLYYYPPSTPKNKQVYEEDDTESESDSDEDDDFDVDHNPRIIQNKNKNSAKMTVKKLTDNSTEKSSVEEYSFMEELMQTLDSIFGCSYGGCAPTQCTPTLKSALRRKGTAEYDAPLNRSVSFTKLEIREFNMTLGNHPSAVTGPPVMLDWEPQPTRETLVDLDLYEKARQPRRTRRELKLSFEARRGILENDRGFTVEEVKKAWSEALKIRKQRQETRQQAPHQRMMDEFVESACRKYNRLFEWNIRVCQ